MPLTLLLAAFTLATAAAAPGDGWGVRLPITSPSGAGLRRVELPAQAILALRRADGGDVRVLDADGRPQPMTRLPAPVAPGRSMALAPLPILGAADALKVTGVTLRVDEDQARVVRVDGSPVGPVGGQTLLGVLLDTRRVSMAASGVTLDVVTPPNQPISFKLESSADLQEWTTEGEKVLFRSVASGPLTLPLHDLALAGRVLRVTWRADGRLLSPVAVTGARLQLGGVPDAARLPVSATLPPLTDAHTAEFALPTAVAPAAVGVRPAGAGLPVAIRLLGRTDREQSWTEVGSGVAAARSPSIGIGHPYREWRIVAAGGGFEAPPAVELRFSPVAIAFLPAGRPPFSLVAGRADATPDALPMATLARMAGEADAAMEDATVAAAPVGAVALPALAAGSSPRTWLLWGVLLAGVAALGAMAWTLTRSASAARSPTDGA